MPSRTARATNAPNPSRRTACVALAAALTVSIGVANAQQSKTTGVAPLGSAPTGSEVIKAPSDDVKLASAAMPMGPAAYAGDVGYAGEMPPMSAAGSGGYFNPTIGSHIRARYNTRSYGQQEGTFDIGTMRMMELDGGFAFLDGQVTLNDESRVGYNLGAGYRWLTLPMFPFSPDDQKIMGISIWSDGQTFGAEQFVPQVGVGFEMLGDRIDFRANGYVPLGPTRRTRDFAPTGDFGYTQNFIADQFVGVQDTLLTVAEAELAGRLGNLDAWAFGSVYGFRGGEYEEVGGKLGLRGYATPDVLLSIAVTSDDLFDTRAVFNATWFIGRTRAENCPSGVLTDRFREPVLRNQYIAAAQDQVFGARGPLRDADNELIRVVHVNSGAADGGDGTFENPYNEFSDVNQGAEMEGDIILVHAGTSYTDDGIALLDNQRLLGEGVYDNGNPAIANTAISHTVSTLADGDVVLPETFDGAFDTAAPLVTNSAGFDAVTMADANEVNNLRITGGDSAITSGPFDPTGVAGGAGDPTLQNLIVSDTIGDAIVLNSYLRTDTDPNPDVQTVEFNVLIDEVQLSGIGGNGIVIDASDDDGFGTNVSDDPDITLNESIDITNVTSTGGAGVGIDVRNAHGGTDVNISDYTYDGEATGLGALSFTNVGGTDGIGSDGLPGQVNISDSNLTGGAAAGTGLAFIDSAAQFTVAADVTIDDLGGTTVLVDGDGLDDVIEGDVNIAADVDNDDGRSFVITGLSAGSSAVNVSGDVTDTGDGIEVTMNTDGVVNFTGAVDINSDSAVDAVSLVDNGDATSEMQIDFNGGLVVNSTGGGEGFVATQGGLIGVNGGAGTNTLSTDGSTALRMNGVEVAAGGVTFSQVDATNAVNGVVLEDLTGGQVQIGDENATSSIALGTGGGGVISSMTGNGVVIRNTQDVEINGLLVQDPAAGASGIDINHDSADDSAMTVTLNNVGVATSTPGTPSAGDGVSVTQGTGANEPDNAFTLNVNDSAVSETNNGFVFTNVIGDVNASETTVLDVAGIGIDVQDSNGNINFTFANDDGVEFSADGTVININGGTGGTKVFEGDINNTAGDAVVITGTENPGITISGDIENSGGRIANVDGNDGGNITFSGDLEGTGTGILVQNNSGDGVLNFVSNVDLNTGASNAVTLQNNVTPMTTTLAYDVNFTMAGAEQLTIQTTGGAGFFADNGGTLSVTGVGNTISATGGVGLLLTDTDIDTTDGVTFEQVTANGATNGIAITNAAGGAITIGDGGGTVGDGGTLNTTGAAIVLSDAANVTINDVDITGSGATAIDVDSTNDQIALATFNNIRTPAGGAITTAVDIDQTGTGSVNVMIADSELLGATGDAVTATGVDGVVQVNDTTIDNGAGRAVFIENSDGAFTFDADTELTEQGTVTGDAFVVDGGEANVTFNGSITNTGGRAVLVQNQTAGGVTFGAASTVDETGEGVLLTNNTGATHAFNGELNITTIDTTAFDANGGGTVTVTGTENDIATTGTGTGVNLDGVEVGAGGVRFDTVNVDSGTATNAVVLNNVTGTGTVRIGDPTSSTDGETGTFDTTGAAIVVTNSADLEVNNVSIAGAGATAIDIEGNDATDMRVTLNNVDSPTAADVQVDHTGTGDLEFVYNDSTIAGAITMNHSGDGLFDFGSSSLTVNSNVALNATNGGNVDFFATDLVVNTGADVTGLEIALAGTVSDADISLNGSNTSITTQDASGVLITSAGSAKNIDFALSTDNTTNTVVNNSAANEAFRFVNDGGSTLNATIGTNRFSNAGAGEDFLLQNAVGSRVELSFLSNVATTNDGLVLDNTANGAGQFTLDAVDDLAVQNSNGNDVDFQPAEANFTFDDTIDVLQPTN